MKRILSTILLIGCVHTVAGQTNPPKINYGYNETVGKYFEVAEDTKLYYEIYGSGEPILMLHGGVYGYIDEFKRFIDELSKNFQIICLATRGHVKSDIGHEPFTFDQRASDAVKLLVHLDIKKATIIGFSDGGVSAFKLAANHPEYVEKMIVIGAGDLPEGGRPEVNYTAEGLLNSSGRYFKKRIAAMPEPDRWAESLLMLNDLYNKEHISKETFVTISSPVLLLAGENDDYASPESLAQAHKYIQNSSVAIIQACGHIVFSCNWDAVLASITPFLAKDKWTKSRK